MKRKIWLAITLPIFGFMAAQSGSMGLNTANPGSTLDINGSLAAQFRTVSAASYTMTNSDFYLAYGGTVNSVFTLPGAITGPGNFKGRMYTVKIIPPLLLR